MANKDPSRTEMPTEKRIKDAREEGNVLSCPDVNSLIGLFGGLLSVLLTYDMVRDGFYNMIATIQTMDVRRQWTDTEIILGFQNLVTLFAKMTVPSCLILLIAGLLAMRVQVGTFFSAKPMKFKGERLWNPKAAMNEIFPNKDVMMNFLITGAKVFLVGFVIYLTVKMDLDEILRLCRLPLGQGSQWLGTALIVMTVKILAVYTGIVAVAYWHRRKQYFDNLMMTKQEVKDERRNSEGDPMVKAKIRGKMREIFAKSIRGEMKKADLVVTNPTHVAVAMRYKMGVDAAPVVIAKGLRKKAEFIKELAREGEVPIVEAPPLARSLYRNVKTGKAIPPEFYKAVATILARIHRTAKKRKKAA